MRNRFNAIERLAQDRRASYCKAEPGIPIVWPSTELPPKIPPLVVAFRLPWHGGASFQNLWWMVTTAFPLSKFGAAAACPFLGRSNLKSPRNQSKQPQVLSFSLLPPFPPPLFPARARTSASQGNGTAKLPESGQAARGSAWVSRPRPLRDPVWEGRGRAGLSPGSTAGSAPWRPGWWFHEVFRFLAPLRHPSWARPGWAHHWDYLDPGPTDRHDPRVRKIRAGSPVASSSTHWPAPCLVRA